MSCNWDQIDKFSQEEKLSYYSYFDKLITLSVGTLTLSITLRDKFVSPNPAHIALLELSWIGFIFTVFFSLLVHRGRIIQAREAVKAAFQSNNSTSVIEIPRKYEYAAKLASTTFFIAIFSLTLFAFFNI